MGMGQQTFVARYDCVHLYAQHLGRLRQEDRKPGLESGLERNLGVAWVPLFVCLF